MRTSLFAELWYHIQGINSESFCWEKAMLTELDKRKVSIQLLAMQSGGEKPPHRMNQWRLWNEEAMFIYRNLPICILAWLVTPLQTHYTQKSTYSVVQSWGEEHIPTPLWICSKKKPFALMLWSLNKTTKFSPFCNNYNVRIGMWTYTVLI